MVKGTVKKNIIAGLLVTVPAALTYIILQFVITRIDGVMAPVVSQVIGQNGMKILSEYSIPGIGFLLLILFVFL